MPREHEPGTYPLYVLQDKITGEFLRGVNAEMICGGSLPSWTEGMSVSQICEEVRYFRNNVADVNDAQMFNDYNVDTVAFFFRDYRIREITVGIAA